MADYAIQITRVAQGSDIPRLAPGRLVQIFASGTNTLVAEIVSDTNGIATFPTLASGKYDIRVDGKTIFPIHHVKADHVHTPDYNWSVFFSGAISADANEANTRPVFCVPVAAKIIRVQLTAESVTSTGDVTAHILRGAKEGASALAFATDSIWSQRIYKGGGSTVKRFSIEATPNLQLNANDTLTAALDYVAAGVEGVNLIMTVRPD